MGPNRTAENAERRRFERIVHYYPVPPPAPRLDQLLLDIGVAVRRSSLEQLRIALHGQSRQKRSFNEGQKRYLSDLADVLVEENQLTMFDCLLSHHMGYFDWWVCVIESGCLADWLPILLKYGVNLNELYMGRPNWWDCIGLKDTSALKLVLESGKVDVNRAYYRGGMRALDHAAERRSLSSFRLLLDAGADPHRSCALTIAAGMGNWYRDDGKDESDRGIVKENKILAFIKYLLDEVRMDVNKKTSYDGRLIRRAAPHRMKTALDQALDADAPRRVLLLLQRGANFGIVYRETSHVLEYAKVTEADDEVQMMLQAWLTTRRNIK